METSNQLAFEPSTRLGKIKNCISCRFCRMRTAVKLSAVILAGALISVFLAIKAGAV